MRSLLGDIGSSLRGRPRPRFTGDIPLRCCCLRGDCEACLFTGGSDLSRVLARDELEAATTISSSSSCRGICVLGIMNPFGAKNSVMLLAFFDMVAHHQYIISDGCVFDWCSAVSTRTRRVWRDYRGEISRWSLRKSGKLHPCYWTRLGWKTEIRSILSIGFFFTQQ